jgi:hypothetical protein
MRLAKRYNGVGIVWEHRYYGQSLPFPVNVSQVRIAISASFCDTA